MSQTINDADLKLIDSFEGLRLTVDLWTTVFRERTIADLTKDCSFDSAREQNRDAKAFTNRSSVLSCTNLVSHSEP